MRLALALGTALTLSACAGDRVTLLSHADGGPIGSVAVLQEGDEDVVLDTENQQVKLRAGRPRLRQLAQSNPDHAELLQYLPSAPISYVLPNFPVGSFSLSDESKEEIEAFMCLAEFREGCARFFPECSEPTDVELQAAGKCPVPRPGYKVEIRGFTDTTGGDSLNDDVSQNRATEVAEAMRALGYNIDLSDALGLGEGPAKRSGVADEFDIGEWRKVEIVIR